MTVKPSSRSESRRNNTMSTPNLSSADPATFLSLSDLSTWQAAVDQDPLSQLAATVLKSGLQKLEKTRDRQIADMHVFSVEVRLRGGDVTDQGDSARCWIFACLNVLRVLFARKYDLYDFELSQSYIYFYGHISKANSFLELMLKLAHLPIESRELNWAFKNSQAQDNGDWDHVVSLIQEFGLVPLRCYPETANSSNTEMMDNLVNSKLRDYCLDLRKAYREAIDSVDHEDAIKRARELKAAQLKEIYKILSICMGAPPHPQKPFTWEYLDSSEEANQLTMTPLEFAASIKYDLNDTILLANDPRNEYNKVYTIQDCCIVLGRRQVRYINVSSEVMEAAVTKQLDKGNLPVWFGTDVSAAIGATDNGIMDPKILDYQDAFSIRINLNKAERIRTTDSENNHAMVFVGCHIDDTGKTVRYKVANSYGGDVCDHGYLAMTATYFEEYVFEVAVGKEFVPPEIVKIYENDEAIILPPWDPMN